jgi:hypothetical protein
MTQLSARTQAARLDETLKHKIRDCKHSASRTAEEQGCDCARCFATIKKIQAKTTLKDRSAPIKEVIINTLQDFKRDGILCLPAIKNAAIIDFASCTPTIVGKELLEDQIHYGQVREKTFDLLNFPEDSDSRGNEVRRDATIGQEHRHRAKSIWHPEQIKLRDDRIRQLKLQVHEKDLIKLEKSKNMWRDNKKCEEEILSRVATLKDATLEHLEKSKATLLQAFVRVRRNVDSTETMARKGKAKEVRDKVRDKTGKPLLLQTAFELRDSPVVWEEPSAEQQVVPESSIVIPSPMVIPASGARVVPDFTVTDAWHKLAIQYIASIEILGTASAPSVNDVNLRTKKLSLLLLSRLERNLGQRLGISEDKKNHWCYDY